MLTTAQEEAAIPVKLNSTGGGSVTLTTPSTASDFTLTVPAGNGTILTTAGVTTPVEFPAGTAALPSITTTGDTNTGLYFPAADTVATTTGGTERMRIDSSGNVGIGTSSPGYTLDVRAATGSISSTSTTGTNYAKLQCNNTGGSYQFGIDNSGGTNFGSGVAYARVIWNDSTSAPTIFYTNSTERARIDSSGNLLVLTSSTLFASSHAFVNSGQAVLGLRNSGSTAGKYWQVGPDGGNSFKVYNQSSVGMFMSDGSTSWSSSSDERQKNIIEPISNAVAKVGSLRAVIGSYKEDEENRRRSFLIAQDVEQALPEAVTTAPDGFLGVAYTDVIPLLVAAIQEQQTRIAALESRLTALEAK